MFNLITNTMVWIIIGALGVWHVAIHTYEQQFVTYPDCKTMAVEHPNGIAAEWVPQIGPHRVLSQDKKKVWRATIVTTIDDSAYWKQHNWLDADGDGILCEELTKQG
jgi:7-cyano-7-deazaguanine synthase in queuosine biosynthesis